MTRKPASFSDKASSEETPTRVAIAVVRSGGSFLVGVRLSGATLAGKAEFPGGKVEPGESVADAAVRECLEESGLRVEVRGEYLSTCHRYDHGLLEVHFLDCRPLDPEAKPRPPFRWISAAELKNLDFPEANAPLTSRLLEDCAKLG